MHYLFCLYTFRKQYHFGILSFYKNAEKVLCAATSISYLIERCVLLCLLNSLVVCPHAKIYMCGKSIRMFLMHTNTRSLILFPKVVCLPFLILIHADKRRFWNHSKGSGLDLVICKQHHAMILIHISSSLDKLFLKSNQFISDIYSILYFKISNNW